MNHYWQNPVFNLAQHSGFHLFFCGLEGFSLFFKQLLVLRIGLKVFKSGRNFLLKVNNFIFKHSKVIFFFNTFLGVFFGFFGAASLFDV